jgi:hypothetical protein
MLPAVGHIDVLGHGMRSRLRAGAALLAAAGVAIATAACTAGAPSTPGTASTPAGAGVPSAPAAQMPASPRYRSTAPAGTSDHKLLQAGWTDPNNGYNVRQDMWACPGNCGTQTLWANSSSNWGVVSDQPPGNTAVLSYPDVQYILTLPDDQPAPLSGFTTITSSFSQSMPSDGDFEAAYDIWLNNWNTEVMIWTDNHGQQPAGAPVPAAVLDGQTWTLWAGNGKSGGYPTGPFSFVLDGNETSGTVNILATLDYLMSHGYIPTNSAINDVEYGWEICSTNGKAENFEMHSFVLHTQMK